MLLMLPVAHAAPACHASDGAAMPYVYIAHHIRYAIIQQLPPKRLMPLMFTARVTLLLDAVFLMSF